MNFRKGNPISAEFSDIETTMKLFSPLKVKVDSWVVPGHFQAFKFQMSLCNLSSVIQLVRGCCLAVQCKMCSLSFDMLLRKC